MGRGRWLQTPRQPHFVRLSRALLPSSGTLGYAVPSGTCSYYSTQKRSVIVKAIFQEGPPFRAGRRSMREDKTAVLQRPFCAFQGGLRFKAATALA